MSTQFPGGRRAAGEGGQSMVEFALTAGVLVLVLLGLFDLGRAIYYFDTISGAARESARLSIVCGGADDTNCSAHDANTKSFVVSTTAGVPITTGQISISPSTRKWGDTVTAIVEVTYTPLTPLISAVLGPAGLLDLSARSHMVVN